MEKYLAIVLVLIATFTDIRSRRIPNWLTFSGILLGFVLNLVLGGLSGLGESVLGFSIGVGLLVIPFVLGGIGAGDVKLLAAIGALTGVRSVLYTACYGALAGGVMALGLLAITGELAWVWMGLRTGSYRTNATLPYGVAIAIGTVSTFMVM